MATIPITMPYHYTPRPYQMNLHTAIDRGFKRGLAVWHRRAGKDKEFINMLAIQALQRRGTYFYILPYYTQARLVIWESMDKDGFRTRDHIPPQVVERMNNQQMTMELKNGSFIRFLGSDNIDAIVGSNPVGVLFSEFSLHKPAAWDYLRPILIENGGWAFFNGTPRGKNHMWRMRNAAIADPSWFYEELTIEDTGVMTPEQVQEEIDKGMPEALAKQEFYCSFDAANVGAYYGDLMDSRVFVGEVPPVPDAPVVTAWDLGVHDSTVIWFFQVLSEEIRFLMAYANNNKGLPHYVQFLQEQDYVYDYHLLPWDAGHHGLNTGNSRETTLRRLGLKNVIVVPKGSIADGIHAVRQMLPLCKFDREGCAEGIEAIRDYRREWDDDKQVFRNVPLRDWTCHHADALRTAAMGMRKRMGGAEFMTVPRATHGYNLEASIRPNTPVKGLPMRGTRTRSLYRV